MISQRLIDVIIATIISGAVISTLAQLCVAQLLHNSELLSRKLRVVIVVFSCAASFVVFSHSGMILELIVFLPFVLLSAVILAVDIAEHRIPNLAVVVGYLFFTVAITTLCFVEADINRLWESMIGGTSFFACYLLLALIRPGNLGAGDVKLAGIIGMVLGFVGLETALLGFVAGFVVGALWGVILLIAGRSSLKSHIAFGPSMILGSFLVVWIS